MSTSTQDKVDGYVTEATSYVKMTAKGRDWAEVESLYNDMFNRIDEESDAVKSGVAERAITMMDKVIGIIGKMNMLLYKGMLVVVKSRLPNDIAMSKRNIAKVESYAGDKITARVAHYFEIIKSLPDNDERNPEMVMKAMRLTCEHFKEEDTEKK